MPNPRPKLENLKPFKRKGDRELGKIIGTRYPVEVEQALSKLENHQTFIRDAVEKTLIEQGLLQADKETAPESGLPQVST